MDWKNKKVLVTGGAGFLGKHVVKKLKERGCKKIFVPRSKTHDLRKPPVIRKIFKTYRPDIVIHLAAVVGGIGANKKNPAKFFFENALMGILLIDEAHRAKVEKVICLGTICAYPKITPVPFREEDLWNGYPEETNAPYGLAKRMLLVQCQAYREQYGLNSLYLMPVNLYGPEDSFDLESGHVIPAIVRKCVAAKEQGASEIVLWGNGKVTREFLYVEDAAEGILRAAENFNGAEPVNLGSGQEIAISDLAALVAKTVGFTGRIRWDESKPNGQPRRCVSVEKAKNHFNFTAQVSLEKGLEKTVAWFLTERPDLKAIRLSKHRTIKKSSKSQR